MEELEEASTAEITEYIQGLKLKEQRVEALLERFERFMIQAEQDQATRRENAVMEREVLQALKKELGLG